MRPISTEGLRAPAAVNAGPAPSLMWLPIEQLVVDDTYQRPIAGTGRVNVQKIAAAFDWSKFAAVVVSPVPGGKFAIIDGQHRTTAAALAGIDTVPCLVVLADREGQAKAFRAINAQTTRVSPLALWKASLVAGDPVATAVDRAARSAGVEILRYAIARELQKPGQTMAVQSMIAAYKAFGASVFVRALRLLTASRHNTPGRLDPVLIAVLLDLAKFKPPTAEAFNAIDLDEAIEEGRRIAATKGEKPSAAIVAAIRNRVAKVAA